jgi:hypothetical protein
LKDLEPIFNIAVSAFGLVINPLVPAKTLKEFINYVNANRGKLSYGHAGASPATTIGTNAGPPRTLLSAFFAACRRRHGGAGGEVDM